MSKDAIIALGAGVLSGVASLTFLAGSTGALLFIYLAPLPLMMVGLGLGVRAGGMAAAAGLITAAAGGGILAAGLYGVIQAAPAWLVTRFALVQRTGPGGKAEWFPAGSVLCCLTALIGAVYLSGIVGIFTGEGTLQENVARQLHHVFELMFPTLMESDRGKVVSLLAPLFPGAVGTSWVLMITANALIAQSLLARMGRNLRPTPVYRDLQLPEWMSWILVASATLALIGSGDLEYIGRNLTVVMAVPYFFVGLAIIHSLARHLAFPVAMLAGVYLALFVSGWAAFVVAGVGVVEQWFGLRRHFPGAGGNKETE